MYVDMMIASVKTMDLTCKIQFQTTFEYVQSLKVAHIGIAEGMGRRKETNLPLFRVISLFPLISVLVAFCWWSHTSSVLSVQCVSNHVHGCFISQRLANAATWWHLGSRANAAETAAEMCKSKFLSSCLEQTELLVALFVTEIWARDVGLCSFAFQSRVKPVEPWS